MQELKILYGGKALPTDTAENLKVAITILQGHLKAVNTQNAGQPVDPRIPKPSPKKLKSDWIDMAWDFLGNPTDGVPNDALLDAMIQIGYPSNAQNPLRALISEVYKTQNFINVQKRKGHQPVWVKKPAVKW